MSFFTDDNSQKILDENLSVLEKEADLLKAVSHPIRLCIVKGLLAEEGCNVSEMQNCLKIPQSTLSQHLTKLREAGILKSERNGLERNYYVVNDQIVKIVEVLDELKLDK
ncbi:MAG: ArsR/SmtB family transcription factor [Halanaerobium sp.]